MDYVEWVEKVMVGTAEAWRSASGHQQLLGVDITSILGHLNVPDDGNPLQDPNSKLGEGIRDALNDLDRMGLIEFEYNRQFKLTQEGSKLLKAALSNSWPQIMDVYITDEQHSFLSKLVELSEDRSSDSVRMTEIEGQHVHECLGLTWDHDGSSQTHLVMQRLEDVGMIRGIFTAGSSKIWPTYVGAVKVTRELESSLGQKIRELLEDWETTNVEFKRELDLNRNPHKGLLVKELLGLVTTKSSGARYLVIGFDDNTHEFTTTVDPAITQDRIEDILNAYCVQAPRFKFTEVPFGPGAVGLIELYREPEKVPYRVAKSLGGKAGIQEGEIFVRHGSHTEAPTPLELEGLQEEGDAARVHTW